MEWYRNLRIGTKLGIGFALSFTVVFIVGLSGMYGMGRIHDTVENLYSRELISTVYTNEAYLHLIYHNRRLYRHILAEDKVSQDQIFGQIDLDEKKFLGALEKYRTTHLTATEKELLDRLDSTWPRYAAVSKRLLQSSFENRDRESLRLAESDARPLFKDLEQCLEQLIRYNMEEGKQDKDSANALIHDVVVYIISIMSVSLTVGALMAYFITRSIVSPIRKTIDAFKVLSEKGEEKVRLANAIASGDLSNDVPISQPLLTDLSRTGNDEAGILLKEVVTISRIQSSVDSAFSVMTGALRISQKEEQERDRLQTGLNYLNAYLRGDRRLEEMLDLSLSYLCNWLGAGIGVLYHFNERTQELEIAAGYAMDCSESRRERIALGEGLAGQAAKERDIICMDDIPPDYLPINSALGESRPMHIAAVPLIHGDKLVGLLELGSFGSFSTRDLDFLEEARKAMAVGIRISVSRRMVDDLLEETQSQAEELRVQQEELQQTNEELEERAQMLEQQREQIRRKNIEVEKNSQELQRKTEELERTSAYKSEFLANMSHELRTPLNSLMILSSLLRENRDGNLTAKQVEYAATINSAGKDLLNLINDILDLSKIESGKLEFSNDELILAELCSNISALFTPIAEERGISFMSTLDDGLPPAVTTDSQRTQQILKNLISNACKFTRQGEVGLRVYLPNPAENPLTVPAIAFSVSDTGIGIHEDKHDMIFQAFQQADGSTSRKFGGTGLGLSISRQLARGLQGEITLSSEEGKGSVFTLYLPITPQQHKEPPDRQAPVTPPAPSSAPETCKPESLPAAPRMPPPLIPDDRDHLSPEDRCILIIEDDLPFAAILMETVRKRGFKAVVAGDGESGVMLANTLLPNAIILDVMLPHIDGWGVMRILKNSIRTRHIPVHFLTCLEDRQKAMNMGAVGFMTKPVSSEQLDEVFSTIEDAVSRTVRQLLIVEDDANEAKSMVALLEGRDVSITVADSGRAAIENLKSRHFDCIVLDLGLEDISGFEILEQIQQIDVNSRIPVIIHSGRDLKQEEELQLRHYAERIIIKGAKSPERLLNEVSLFLHFIEGAVDPDRQQMIVSAMDKESTFEGKKVLIVDDDMRNIFSLSSVLSDKNMQVLEAENGRVALEQINRNPDTDIVLMDIMMPEMDGFTAIREIRRDPRFRSLPIIALTAKAMRGDHEACLEAGASDYITKPVDIEKLFSLLRVWLYSASARA